MNNDRVKSGLLRRTAAFLCGAAMAFSSAYCFPGRTAQAAQRASAEVSADIGLVGNLFCISGSDNADHAELQWATTLKADSFTLYRSTSPEDGFEQVYQGGGASWEDSSMELGKTYYYQLAVDTSGGRKYSSVKSLEPVTVPQGLSTYDNQKGSSLVYETGGYKVGDTYYSYSLKKHPGMNDIYLAETVSRDGRNFGSERNVADSTQNSDLADCKIESIHIDYVPEKNKVVVWAHWEKPSGYSDGKALVITGTPGGEFTVHHVYNPLGIQVRDMAMFFDDDSTGYLIAAANKEGQGANATMYIFRMNDDYSGVTEVVKTLFEDQYREFPNLVKKNGYYFLFTSQAAGWYPSSGAYSVTDDLYGEWSGLRNIGNSSTFSSQSGWIVDLKGRNYLMHAYRWIKGTGTSGTTLCPLYFDNGFAFYDYCPYFRYSTSTGDLYPVQQGELLSQDKPASASIASDPKYPPSRAVDGNYNNSFIADDDHKKWPFYIQIDLEDVCDLANIQTSWYICKGSEGYYTYTVDGSTDGVNWTKLLDRTDTGDDTISKTYGFNSDMLKGRARYVRLNVKNATLQNNPTNNWYTPRVYEIKIYGSRAEKGMAPVPAVKYDFETSSGGMVPDISGNGGDMKLSGSAGIAQNSEKGSVLKLDGSDGGYGSLPGGLLDGCDDYTVVMDARSDSEGDFFTFAGGQDKEKYIFFKIAKDHFRFQTTVDTWRGETGFRYDLDGTKWHRYVLAVNGSTGRLYVDGEKVAEDSTFTTHPSDMGRNQVFSIGKSFYGDDVYFTGEIDNLAVYRQALTPAEIAALSGTVQQSVRGDVNADGTLNIADLVTMERFLLGAGDMKAPAAGDLDSDGKVTAFDLVHMRRLLTD